MHAPTFDVSETFDSIQGEGSLAGLPSTFIRLAKCNLACSWCDAAYTWKGRVEFETLPLDELVGRVHHSAVVVTGGEPTFADNLHLVLAGIRAAGAWHTTVETNGVLWREDCLRLVSLWSVSPKLGTSGQKDALNEETLRRYRRLPKGTVQFKFVVGSEDDFAETLALLERLDVDGHPVFMQPNGLCHNVALKVDGHTVATDAGPAGREWPVGEGLIALETPYLDRVRWLYELVVEADAAGQLPCPVRVVPQLHKLAWGNRRGF